MYILQNNISWQLLVGQAIGQINKDSDNSDGSIINFLGEELINNLILNL